MARIRSIKPGFFLNEAVASLPFEWRLLFVGLWTQADREGRLEDRPQRLKASLFPYDNLSIDEGLNRLVAAGLIIRYEGAGQPLIAIPTWTKHQQPHIRESASELPAPDASTVLAQGQPLCLGKGREQIQEGKEGSAVPASDTTPTLLTFPTVGSGPKSWALTEARCAGWAELYPGLDVLGECRKALAWVQANQPKTAKGMPAFLVRWFNKAVQHGGSRSVAPRPAAKPSAAVWECPHVEHCSSRSHCQNNLTLGKKPLKAVSA